MLAKQDLKILFIQIRKNPQVKEQEYGSFLRLTGLGKKNFKVIDAFNDQIRDDFLEGIHGVIIAGSEESVLNRELSFLEKLEDFIRHCYDLNFPTLGICFGHQLIAQALGGTVIHDKYNEEVGSFPIVLTEEGKQDRVFSSFPESFVVQYSHEYRVENFPGRVSVLATSKKCNVAAFAFQGKNIYGVQFHPDRDRRAMLERLDLFTKGVDDFGLDLTEVRKRVLDTPEADTFLSTYIDTILLNK